MAHGQGSRVLLVAATRP